MRVLDTIRRNPAAVLSVVTAAVLGWVAAGLLNPPSPPVYPPLASPPTPVAAAPIEAPPPPELPGLRNARSVAVEVLPKLRPGMTRVEVEGMLGPPTADDLHPVTLAEGRLTYRTAYELAEPDLPATIRPIVRPRVPARPTDPKSQVALEFDASKPGHPLVEVLYLDPLF
jgi:hypothetical protein